MSLFSLLIHELLLLVLIFFFIRFIWIDKKKTDFFHDFGEESLDWFPSTSSMLIKFWCWNIVKFIRDEDKTDGYYR